MRYPQNYNGDYNGTISTEQWEEIGYKNISKELPPYNVEVYFLCKPMDCHASHRLNFEGEMREDGIYIKGNKTTFTEVYTITHWQNK